MTPPHHGGAGADAGGPVHATVHDLHVLEQLIHEFLSHHLDILFHGLARALTDAIYRVFRDGNADQLGQFRAGGRIGHALTNERPLAEVSVSGRAQG
jgi:hypothetical protein